MHSERAAIIRESEVMLRGKSFRVRFCCVEKLDVEKCFFASEASKKEYVQHFAAYLCFDCPEKKHALSRNRCEL